MKVLRSSGNIKKRSLLSFNYASSSYVIDVYFRPGQLSLHFRHMRKINTEPSLLDTIRHRIGKGRKWIYIAPLL